MNKYLSCLLIAALTLTGCSENPPSNFTDVRDSLHLYPDYQGVTLPCNIAPLHFQIVENADAYRIFFTVDGIRKAVFHQQEVRFDVSDWHAWLRTGKTSTLAFETYLKRNGKWYKYPVLRNTVVPDTIDRYLTYRLIEPSYVAYNDLSIRQRDLSNFDERIVYTNEATNDKVKTQCVNCHAFQNFHTEQMQFHVRGDNGGTIVCMGGKLKKLDMKSGKLYSSGVYPAWHPTERLITYSVNSIGQFFHKRNTEKVEVQDDASALILLDPNTEKVSVISNDTNQMATFPAWSPDGKMLYYAVAPYLPVGNYSCKGEALINNYRQVRYSIERMPFDVRTRRFGKAERIYDASLTGKSASFPRVSPDGRYLLFTLAEYGTFHIWHKSSDLHLLDLKTGQERMLENVNSPEVESYHTWSSNGRWIVFSSRREDGSYTRPYIAWFDRNGKAHKPFVLPQRNPEHYLHLMKSYNIPELTVEPVDISIRSLVQTVAKPAVKTNLQ